MAVNTINVEMLRKMFLAGTQNIEAKKEYINELNVFPVPDGDTGTNMSLTIMAAAKEVAALENPDMMALAKAISSGSLRGARGNSGVILSQLFRGFTKVIRDYEELDVLILAEALEKARETAYKAVMKPKEGTILTVARGIADKAMELAETVDDLEEFFPKVIKHAEAVLKKTPDMLPVLKQAGVVDSGGQGLLEVIKGAYDAFLGKEIDYSSIKPSSGVVKVNVDTSADIKFGYCTEFIVMTQKKFTEADEKAFKRFLESIGDSIVCVADDDIVKIHVHTNDPGLAIQKALTYGQLSRMKIDNMREEHEEKLIKDAEKLAAQEKEKEPCKPMGFIAVSIGSGLNEIFKELGVDYIIEGGQTMNPSTEDMLKAIARIYVPVAKKVYHTEVKVNELRNALDSWQDIQKMLYDPKHIKYYALKSVETILRKPWAISGNVVKRKIDDRFDILNEHHTLWFHPCDDHISSNASFMELFEEAADIALCVIEKAYGCIEYGAPTTTLCEELQDQAYDSGMSGEREMKFFDIIYEA
ncbi:MAG: DAK2 domain-containing protein [Longicatena sp.]